MPSDDQNQDSLIRVENSLIARFDSLLRRKKFPVPMRREFPRNSLDLLPYLASLGGSLGLNDQNSRYALADGTTPAFSAASRHPTIWGWPIHTSFPHCARSAPWSPGSSR